MTYALKEPITLKLPLNTGLLKISLNDDEFNIDKLIKTSNVNCPIYNYQMVNFTN